MSSVMFERLQLQSSFTLSPCLNLVVLHLGMEGIDGEWVPDLLDDQEWKGKRGC